MRNLNKEASPFFEIKAKVPVLLILLTCFLIPYHSYGSEEALSDSEEGSVSMQESRHNSALVSNLSHFHQNPSDEVLDQFEPGLHEALLDIINDESMPRLPRLRAIAALGRYPDSEDAFIRLSDFVMNPESDVRIRLAALGTLGMAMRDNPLTLDIMERSLLDPDSGIRARTVNILSDIGCERAEKLLARHRFVERHALVRKALRAALEANTDIILHPEGRIILHTGSEKSEKPVIRTPNSPDIRTGKKEGDIR